MDWKLGDFVRFVDERREGYITRIFDNEMVGVTGDDDFEIPVPVSKITRVHGYKYNEIKNETLNTTKDSEASFKTNGIFIAVAPDERKGSVAHFYLINTTSYQLLLSLITNRDNKFKGEYAGIIPPETGIQIYSASLAEVNFWPEFSFRILHHSIQNIAPLPPLIFTRKFKAKDFSGSKQLTPLIKQQGWLIRLDEEEIKIDPEKLKESFFKSPEEKNTVEKPQKEVDLHIENLREDYQFLNKNEILQIQLNHFKKLLDAAIVHKSGSIIFIHGIGNGTLRHEIHKILSKHQQVKTFTDARKERFGYGATEVFLK